MSSANDSTFIEKIQAKRIYADVQTTESDNSDRSSSAAEHQDDSKRGNVGAGNVKLFNSFVEELLLN